MAVMSSIRFLSSHNLISYKTLIDKLRQHFSLEERLLHIVLDPRKKGKMFEKERKLAAQI